jgi:hypothetical protein
MQAVMTQPVTQFSLDSKLNEFEKRPAVYEGEAADARRREFDLAEGSTRLSGAPQRWPERTRIINLHISGRINQKEYIDLCKQSLALPKPGANKQWLKPAQE